MKALICTNCLKTSNGGLCECGARHAMQEVDVQAPKGYKIAMLKKGIVLAESECRTQYVTWAVEYPREGVCGVCWGHYFTSLSDAMSDFTKRVKQA